MDRILRGHGLLTQLTTMRHQLAMSPGLARRELDLGEEIQSQELGEDVGVDLVGLDPRAGDRLELSGVGDHDSIHATAQDLDDRPVRREAAMKLILIEAVALAALCGSAFAAEGDICPAHLETRQSAKAPYPFQVVPGNDASPLMGITFFDGDPKD